jgi:hypothetical protein
MSGLEAFGDTIKGEELVHTSYFDHPEILDLLALHMAWTGDGSDWLQISRSKNKALVHWFTQAKWRAAGRGIPNHAGPLDISPSVPIRATRKSA